MNYRVISKYLGIVALIVAAAMLLSIPWTFPVFGGSHAFETNAFIGLVVSACLSAGSGATLYFVGCESTSGLLRKETMAIVGLSWILAGILGALPFLIGRVYREERQPMTITDALLESASGFSGTGATVITDLEKPEMVARAILFWRSETPFLGGLGIMVLFVAMLGHGPAGKALMRTEMPGPTKETGQSRTQHAAWVFTTIYLVLNLILIALLLIQGMSPFDAICHAFGTIATGGFSTYNDSVAHFHHIGIEMTIAVFMVLACTNFTLLYLLALGKPRVVLADVEFRTYMAVLVVATGLVVCFGIFHVDFASWRDALRYGFLQVAAILTNTGFTTHNFDQWNEIGRGALFLLMFVGGCAGSTSCSVKIIRHVLFGKILSPIRTSVLELKPNGRH